MEKLKQPTYLWYTIQAYDSEDAMGQIANVALIRIIKENYVPIKEVLEEVKKFKLPQKFYRVSEISEYFKENTSHGH